MGPPDKYLMATLAISAAASVNWYVSCRSEAAAIFPDTDTKELDAPEPVELAPRQVQAAATELEDDMGAIRIRKLDAA